MTNINVLCVGCISAGKSTFINGFLSNSYSCCKIKRTTMIPQIYTESETAKLTKKQIKDIKTQNDEKNKAIYEQTEKNSSTFVCTDVEYIINKIADTHNLERGVCYSITDMPGINDARTRSQYVEYINNNFHKYDVILFLIDCTQPCGTTDIKNTIELVMGQISKCKKQGYSKYMITLANKIDDLDFDALGHPKIEDEEIREMYIDIKKLIHEYATKYDIIELCHNVVPISSEEMYIYRTIKHNEQSELEMKYLDIFGTNEYGKNEWKKRKANVSSIDKLKDDIAASIENSYHARMTTSGFNKFVHVLTTLLTPKNQHTMLQNKIAMCMNNKMKPIQKSMIDEQLTVLHNLQLMDTNLFHKIPKEHNEWIVNNKMLEYLEAYKLQMEQYIQTNTGISSIMDEVACVDAMRQYYELNKNLSTLNSAGTTIFNKIINVIMYMHKILIKKKCDVVMKSAYHDKSIQVWNECVNLYNNDISLEEILDFLKRRYEFATNRPSLDELINDDLIKAYRFVNNMFNKKEDISNILLKIINYYLHNSLKKYRENGLNIETMYMTCYYLNETIYDRLDRNKSIQLKFLVSPILIQQAIVENIVKRDGYMGICDKNNRCAVLESLIDFYVELNGIKVDSVVNHRNDEEYSTDEDSSDCEVTGKPMSKFTMVAINKK